MDSKITPSKIKVLCVDDELNILSSLKRMLALSDYEVFTANSGDEGLKVIEAESIDIIISDVRMPIMNGIEFLKKTKEIAPLAIKILLTGNADLNDAVSAVNEGGIFRYLNKPWIENDFLETIRSSIELISLRKDKESLLELTIKQNLDLNDLVVNLESKVLERTTDISNANSKLRDSYISSIKAFANLIELRNKKLFDHSKRVADLSLQLAKKMRLSDKDSQEIFIGGLLHDIGKIGLNDRVLSTKITDLPYSDLDLYKEHTIVGSLCLSGLDGLDSIIKIIKHHHERFDGQGFPSQLKGSNISIGARIVGLVETYFELLEGDISSAPKSQSDAFKLVLKYNNSAFCPTVVLAFSDFFNLNLNQLTKSSILNSSSSLHKDDSNLVHQNESLTSNNDSQNIDQRVSSLKSINKSGSNPIKGIFTFKTLQATVDKYSHAFIRDDRDSSDGFLWVVSGVKTYGGNSEFDVWLKNNKFIYSEPDAAWYFPYD